MGSSSAIAVTKWVACCHLAEPQPAAMPAAAAIPEAFLTAASLGTAAALAVVDVFCRRTRRKDVERTWVEAYMQPVRLLVNDRKFLVRNNIFLSQQTSQWCVGSSSQAENPTTTHVCVYVQPI